MSRKHDLTESQTSAATTQPTVEELQVRRQAVLLGAEVLAALGQPANLFQVQVRRLWEQHFRANVLVGADPTQLRFAHSYFLTTDDAGKIVTATPELRREY